MGIVSRLTAVALLLALSMLHGCGGGGVEQGAGSGAPTPTAAATAPPVTLSFGIDNRITAVSGETSRDWPVSIPSDFKDLHVAVIEGPPFLSVSEGMLHIDASGTPTTAGKFDITIAALDAGGKERGRQTGLLDVVVRGVTSSLVTLENGKTVSLPEFGIAIRAPAGTFVSGSSRIVAERLDSSSSGNSLRVSMDEPNSFPLELVNLVGGAQPSAQALTVRRHLADTGNPRQSQVIACTAPDAPSELATTPASVADKCMYGWVQSSVSYTCASQLQTGPIIAIRSRSDQILPSGVSCNGYMQVATVHPKLVWSKLSGPKDWESLDWTSLQPVILIHGYSPLGGMGGGAGTWSSSIKTVIEDTRLSTGALKVFEFQWKTDTAFEDVADELIDAVSLIKSATGKKPIIIAHSFGGVLTRVAAQGLSVSGRRTMDDEVERIITIGSPHSGVAPKADYTALELPYGADVLADLTTFCRQRSCLQAGASSGVNMEFFGSASFDYSKRGQIIKRIASIELFPLSIPLDVLIGLYSSNYYDGDALIRYDGQRFSRYFNLNSYRADVDPLYDQNGIKEWIIGAPAARSLRAAKDSLPAKVIHSRGLGLTAIGEDYYEPYIENAEHPTWKLITEILSIKQASVEIPLPKISSLSPPAMSADGRVHSLSISGGGFSDGNIVQFMWGVGSDSKLWKTSISKPSITPTVITVDLPTGKVTDTILVRVCRSASATTTTDCSSGSHEVTVTSSLTVTNPQVTAITSGLKATSGAQTVTISGSNFVVSGTTTTVTFKDPAGTTYTCCAAGAPTIGSTSITAQPNFLGAAGTWYVKVTNSGGGDSGWFSFTVAPVVTLLAAPSLTAPANGATGQSTTPTFSWSAVTGANRYWLTVATSSAALPTNTAATSCTGCVISGNTGATSQVAGSAFPNSGTSVALQPGTTYYWRVQAYNTNGTAGEFSTIRSFKTN